jgi:hypothetical protein
VFGISGAAAGSAAIVVSVVLVDRSGASPGTAAAAVAAELVGIFEGPVLVSEIGYLTNL